MKLHLLIKSSIMLLLVVVGLHFVSMPHLSHPVSHGKMVAVEKEESVVSMNLQEDDQKHFDLLNSIQVKDQLILVLVLTSLFIYSSSKSRRKIKHFLYSVYYQSSYFSRNHLFTA
ncbi:MAG: hypothetical protein ACQEWV_22465 [Bacillota bacterium]